MNIDIILLFLIAIPITAIIDYFAFRKRFKEEFKTEMKWYYFITPCLLECGCFIAGYMVGVS